MPSASTAPSSTALPSPSPSLSSPSPATPKLRRILIANRGEIAMRVIHACHDTGRIAIAAYADPDADALFVHAADEAYALGGSDAQSTYLNIAAIVETAHKAHVDAVHPGYGFLAENAEFAQAVIDAGMTWIGPQPATIRALGSKVEARRIAAEVGAPMAPGTTEPVHDPAEVITFAKEHGLPLAIKAVYGGGGRGRWQTRAIGPARFARLRRRAGRGAGRIGWSRRNGGPALTSDSGESVIQALLNAYQKSVPAGSGTQIAANSDIASTQDTPIESTITGTVVRWLADDGAHVEENEPIVVLEAMKMETEITAPVAGILHRSAQVGDTAQYGDPLGAIS